MYEIWDRIDSWLRYKAPEIFDSLQFGADEAQIAAAEQELGLHLPDDLRASLHIHNGQENGKRTLLGSMWHLLSIEQALHEWRLNNHLLNNGHFFDNSANYLPSGQRPIWWCESWLPIAANGAGDFVCIDLSPTSQKRGQILIHWHDSNTCDHLAPDFYTWLRRFADDLDNNRYAVFAQGLVRDTDAWVTV